MATDEQIRITIAAAYRGQAAVNQAVGDLRRVDAAADAANATNAKTGGILSGAGAAWSKLATGIGVASVAMYAVSRAAGAVWGTLKEGAALQTTQLRFEKLSASIGTTADVMIGKLREATQGMISDAELMASASQIMSLKLADNEEQVIRLATVSGRLNWDMQQVILTFANMSTMRLDALGLSVDEVREKAAELEKAGMSASEAFKEAVIQAGEARLDVAGLSEGEQAFKQAEAAVVNFKNAVLESTIATLDQAGAFRELSAIAEGIQFSTQFRAEIKELREEGKLTWGEWLHLLNVLAQSGGPAAEAELSQIMIQDALTDTNAEINAQASAWQLWARQVSIQTGFAASEAIANMNRMFAAASGYGLPKSNTDWFGGGGGVRAPSPLAPPRTPRRSDDDRGLMDWAADAQAYNSLVKTATEQTMSYGAAVGYAISQEDALAAAHARMSSAFMTELNADPADGLIGADGLVNVNAMTDALMQQAQAAGAGAVEMAMLGIATGKFSKEQAAAALKAAVLQEQIRKIAEGVASGNIKYDAAVGYLEEFRQKLDASGGGAEGATTDVEGLIAMAKELTAGPYQADINANTVQAEADLQALLDLINGIAGVHQATVIVQSDTTGVNGPDARASGGPVRGGRPYIVGEAGPELFVPGQSGYVVPNNQLTDFQGGSTLNISITNMVEGRVVGRTHLDDITTDTLLHALRSAGVA